MVGCHTERNQKYDAHPYSYHLEQVYQVGLQFIHLIPESLREAVLAGCFAHDVIEDTGVSYNDVLRATSFEVAEIAYALTTPKGRTRAERHCSAYYEEIRKTPGAAFVKVCDRIANVRHSRDTGSRMHGMYRKEAQKFRDSLFQEELAPMFKMLDQLLT